MAVVTRIARTPKAWSITVSVDCANTIAFDAVEMDVYWAEPKTRLIATAADGSQLIVTPDVLLCGEMMTAHMEIEQDDKVRG